MSVISDECELLVNKNLTFYVDVCSPYLCRSDFNRRFPAHRLVVEPIVGKASEMRIYGLDKEREFHREVLSIGAKKRGYIKIDLSQEVVRGYEIMWNADSWRRGAIVLAAKLSDDELAEIFRWCDGPNVWASLYQIKKGTPVSAIKHAQAIASQGSIAFSFSASNGIQWMDIFPPAQDAMRLFTVATKNCRPFKRYVEHNPGCDEIVIDRAPYLDMV